MIVTLKVPDNTIKLLYTDIVEGWESDPRPIPFSEIIKVEAEDERHPDH